MSFSFFWWLFFLGPFAINKRRGTESFWRVKFFEPCDFLCVGIFVAHGPSFFAEIGHLGIGIGCPGYRSSHKKSATVMWPVHHSVVNNVMLLSLVGFLLSSFSLLCFSRFVQLVCPSVRILVPSLYGQRDQGFHGISSALLIQALVAGSGDIDFL